LEFEHQVLHNSNCIYTPLYDIHLPKWPPNWKRRYNDNSKSNPLLKFRPQALANPTRIAEGQFYEAHQQLRVIASRYVKAQDWDNATSILHTGAQSLLQAGQGGSGGDLCIFLLDAFNKGEVKPDASSKGKLLGLLRAFPKDEPTKKKFVGEMIAWSAKFGEYPAGDPEIHHVAGSLYAEGTFTFDVYDLPNSY
jgi:hypothetical protein